MFINNSALVKQMKTAYAGNGLAIANLRDGLVINAAVWVLWMDNRHLSNEVKAAVMLLAGTLPEVGKMFSVSKTNPIPQYRIDHETVLNSLDRIDKSDQALTVTNVCLFENIDVRLFQDSPFAADSMTLSERKKKKEQPFHGQLYGVNQLYFNMVDKIQLNYDYESDPTGPAYCKSVHNGICWYNEICKLMIMPVDSKRKELLDALSAVKFKE